MPSKGVMTRLRTSLFTVVLAVAGAAAGRAQTPAPEIQARRATTPPRLDGILDDALWAAEPLPLDPWVSYNPLRGEPAQQQTNVWIGYDEDAIYFAFRC